MLQVVLPTLGVPTTGWMSLQGAIQGHYFSKPFWQLMLDFADQAEEFRMRLGVLDKGSGNDKYTAAEIPALESREHPISTEYLPCQNHQTHLGHLDFLVACFGAAFLQRLHQLATFFNLSNHRLRMMVSVRRVLIALVHLEPGFPSPVDKLYCDELIDYLVRWIAVVTGNSRKSRKQKTEGSGVCATQGHTSDHYALYNGARWAPARKQ